MSEGLKDSISEAVKERLASPIWGYLLMSWLGFNWQNLAILFMSDKAVEQRIVDITSQEYFLIKHFLFPVVLGTLLVIFSPYFKHLLSITHRRAEQKNRESIKRKVIDKYDDDIEISDKKIAALNADKLAMEKEETKIVIEKEKQKRESLDTKNLEENIKLLKKQQRDSELSVKELGDQALRIREESDIWRNKSIQAMSILSSYNNISDNRSLNEIKDELSKIFSHEEVEIAGYVVENQRKREIILRDAITASLSLIHKIKDSYDSPFTDTESGEIPNKKSFEFIESELKSALKLLSKSKRLLGNEKNIST